jgi:O-antigen/teichoic acid export membrane protein
MNQSIGKKIASGTVWVITTNLILNGVSIISTIVLAWLLTPADFGIVAMASIITMLMVGFTEVGMNQVIVHHQKPDKAFYDTAWTIQMLRGIILFLFLLLAADPVATFFNEDRLVPVLRVLSLVFLLDGLISIGMARLFKEMRFDLEFQYRIITRFIGLVSAIILALWLRNYWAMILSNILSALTRVGLSFFYAPHLSRPTLRHWRKIFGFSQWVFLRESVGLFSQKLDQILLGRWLGTGLLGQYDMATQIATLPATGLSMPLARSLFPALATLQHQPDRFRHTFSAGLGAIFLVGLPASCGLFLIADSLVSALLPPAWSLVGPLVQILAIYGFIRITFGPCGAALTAMGKVREVFFISATNVVLKCGILYTGYFYGGIMGIAWGTVIAAVPITLLYLGVIRYHNYLRFTTLLKMIWRPVLTSGVMVISVYSVQQFSKVMNWNAGIEISAMIACGVMIYALVLLFLWLAAGKPEGIEAQILRFAAGFKKKEPINE